MIIKYNNIEFHIFNSEDLKLFHEHQKFTQTPALFSDPPNLVQGFSGGKAGRTQRKNRQKKNKKNKEFSIKKEKRQSAVASTESQQFITFNPFIHQVTGSLRVRNVNYKELNLKGYSEGTDTKTLEDWFEAKKQARTDFLKTNYPTDPDTEQPIFHGLNLQGCLLQCSAISISGEGKTKYHTEGWYNLAKQAEAGDFPYINTPYYQVYNLAPCFHSKEILRTLPPFAFKFFSKDSEGVFTNYSFPYEYDPDFFITVMNKFLNIDCFPGVPIEYSIEQFNKLFSQYARDENKFSIDQFTKLCTRTAKALPPLGGHIRTKLNNYLAFHG